jgi:hypothetical protein
VHQEINTENIFCLVPKVMHKINPPDCRGFGIIEHEVRFPRFEEEDSSHSNDVLDN